MASVPYLPRRPRPTRDPQEGGAVTWERSTDDNEAYALDVSEQLPSGDTFASVTAVEVSGVTISAITVTAAGQLSVTVTGGHGSASARLVTAAGRIFYVPLQWRSPFADAGDVYG